MTLEQRERKLRQQIHGLRVKKFHWPIDAFKFIINGLGYGESLKALPEDRLTELKALLLKYRKHGRPQIFSFDRQGKYMFYLMKTADWTESELRAFMITHYSKTHWNLLNKKERRAVIAMLQNYIKQNEKKTKNTTKKETSNGHPQDPQS
jgi:hypothetical protein